MNMGMGILTGKGWSHDGESDDDQDLELHFLSLWFVVVSTMAFSDVMMPKLSRALL